MGTFSSSRFDSTRCTSPKRQVGAVEFVDDNCVVLLDHVHQHLDVLMTDQASRVLSDDLGQVCCDDAAAIDHGVAFGFCLAAEFERYPLAGKSEDRLGGGFAGQRVTSRRRLPARCPPGDVPRATSTP